MKSFALWSALGLFASAAAMGASETFHRRHQGALDVRNQIHTIRHRRHHQRSAERSQGARRSNRRKKRSNKCKSKATATANVKVKATSTLYDDGYGYSSEGYDYSSDGYDYSATATASSAKSTKSSSSSSSSSSSHCPSGSYLSPNGVCFGALPDGGSDGGSKNTIAQLNNLITSTNSKLGYFGQYAQVTSSSWDGGQLTQVLDDLKDSGAIFQPAVMPTGGWSGFTEDDNSAAQAVCKIMKTFTDEGIETWLRFAHECNYYITDGTYQGSLSDCKTGFQVVAAACKDIAPDVKMFWTPNAGSLSTFEQMWPGSDYVDYIGIDYYPTQGSDLDSAFITMMQPLHDKYTSSSGPYFAIGEMGLAWEGTSSEKIQYAKSAVSAVNTLSNLVGLSWFNYYKSSEAGNFKIIDPDDSTVTNSFVSMVQQF